MTEQDQAVLTRQIEKWKRELSRIAALVAAAEGGSCAVVLISTSDADADYEGVHPQLVAEDAFGVDKRGWPEGFSVEVLNAD